MHHASYPVFVHRPAASDWASFRPRLATTPLPFSLPSALRKPGRRTFTYEVTRHARRTRKVEGRRAFAASRSNVGLGIFNISIIQLMYGGDFPDPRFLRAVALFPNWGGQTRIAEVRSASREKNIPF